MKNNKILLVGGAVLASEVLWYIYKRVYNVWSNYIKTREALEVQIPKSRHDISEVMFFTNESTLCRIHFTTEMTCPKNNCPVRYLR